MSESIDLHEIVKKHASILSDHGDRLDDHEERLDEHDRIFLELRRNLAENKDALSRIEVNGATKDDINGILRDALNAVPGKQSVIWAAAMAVIAGVALFMRH